jgi:hypothetical protein
MRKKKGAIYTGEFRVQVVKDMLENRLSYAAAARKHGLFFSTSGKEFASTGLVSRWLTIYRDQGEQGLLVETRGAKHKEPLYGDTLRIFQERRAERLKAIDEDYKKLLEGVDIGNLYKREYLPGVIKELKNKYKYKDICLYLRISPPRFYTLLKQAE